MRNWLLQGCLTAVSLGHNLFCSWVHNDQDGSVDWRSVRPLRSSFIESEDSWETVLVQNRVRCNDAVLSSRTKLHEPLFARLSACSVGCSHAVALPESVDYSSTSLGTTLYKVHGG